MVAQAFEYSERQRRRISMSSRPAWSSRIAWTTWRDCLKNTNDGDDDNDDGDIVTEHFIRPWSLTLSKYKNSKITRLRTKRLGQGS